MTLHALQTLLFVIFACCAVASWFLISQVAAQLQAANGPPELVKSLSSLAFSGDGGPSIWPGHAFLVRREYIKFHHPQLTLAGNRAFALVCAAYLDAAAMVVAMLLS
jgi:hypothetical protein